MTVHPSSRTLRRFALGLAAAVVFGASPMTAEDVPPKLGPELQVNTFTEGRQHSPDVARFLDGHFVVVWQEDGELPGGVKARLYQGSGDPAGGEVWVTTSGPVISPPRVATLPGGGFAVVWGGFNDIFLRRFDAAGRPLGDAAVVNVPSSIPNAVPDVAADSAGNLAVVWVWPSILEGPILLRRFDAAGNPQGDPVQVSSFSRPDLFSPHVAVNDSGSLLVSWDAGTAGVRARRFDGPSGAWSPEVMLEAPGGGHSAGNAPVLYAEGDGAVVFGDSRLVDVGVFAQRLDAAGAPAGEAVEIGGAFVDSKSLDAVIDPDGRAFVAWSALAGGGARIHGRLLDRSWHPLGDEIAVSSSGAGSRDLEPAVAADASGGFVSVWSDDGGFFSFPPFFPLNGKDGSLAGVFGQLLGDPECAADSEILCLGAGNRFHVSVSWKTPSNAGTGRAHPQTDDTGAFWFFNPDNLELMIKVLDGRAVNGHFWIFYGALSNVEYTITVTDTATGKEKTYHNPQGQLASRADTGAFDGTAAAPAASVAAAAPAVAATGCPIFLTDTTLCLQSGRFFAEVTFTDPRNGTSGPGHAFGLTSDTGTFWFFDASNLELMIKVLDGRPVNGHWWVFFGALSNVAYTIRVTDTETGEQRTYVNPRGQLASRADTSAFPVGH